MESTNDYGFIEELTTGSLEHGSIELILKIFSEFCDVAVAYIESPENIIHISFGSDNFSSNIRLYPIEEVTRLYTHFPVMHYGDFFGSIVIDSPNGVFFPQNRFLPHLANALKICKFLGTNEIFNLESDDAIIDILMSGHKDGIDASKNRLMRKRIDPNGEFCAVAIYFKAEETASEAYSGLLERFRGVAKCFPIPFISCVWHDFFVFYFFVSENDIIKSIINNFKEIAIHHGKEKESPYSIYIGVGGIVRGFENFLWSWNQSVNSIKYALIKENNSLLCLWEDMGINRNISDMAGDPEYLVRCVAMLSPLLEHDCSHKGDLLPTLVAFVIKQWNLTASAKFMYLHYNSIKYRYKKIAEIMKCDLDSPETRFNLVMAVRAHLFSLSMSDFMKIMRKTRGSD